MKMSALRPFVPSGPDYALARRFFADLGFRENWGNDDLCELQRDDVVFWLQNFSNLELQQNLMLQISVDDLDGFYQQLVDNGLFDKYPTVRTNGPKDFPWGQRELHLVDPAGVCWHFS